MASHFVRIRRGYWNLFLKVSLDYTFCALNPAYLREGIVSYIETVVLMHFVRGVPLVVQNQGRVMEHLLKQRGKDLVIRVFPGSVNEKPSRYKKVSLDQVSLVRQLG